MSIGLPTNQLSPHVECGPYLFSCCQQTCVQRLFLFVPPAPQSSRPSSKKISVKTLSDKSNIPLLASEIIDKCKLIHASKLPQVQALLQELLERSTGGGGSGAQRLLRGRPACQSTKFAQSNAASQPPCMHLRDARLVPSYAYLRAG